MAAMAVVAHLSCVVTSRDHREPRGAWGGRAPTRTPQRRNTLIMALIAVSCTHPGVVLWWNLGKKTLQLLLCARAGLVSLYIN